MPIPDDPRVLGSFGNLDDTALYRLNDDMALVLSVDYITPVVNDPYAFGAISAANALSDLYACGASPVLALNLVGFPTKTLPMGMLGEILRGGADKVKQANAWVVGGHSIEDYEPKYGLVVAGFVHPERVIRKTGAKPGDLLVITKPLGSGIITTGIDQGLVDAGGIMRVTALMTALNSGAARAMTSIGVHACTDVTGFGLLGHLHSLLVSSGVAAEVNLAAIPVLPEAWELARQGAVPAGSHSNHQHAAEFVRYTPGISRDAELVLCDAQTSGGLLIAVAPERVQALLKALEQEQAPAAAIIGKVTAGKAGSITVHPSFPSLT